MHAMHRASCMSPVRWAIPVLCRCCTKYQPGIGPSYCHGEMVCCAANVRAPCMWIEPGPCSLVLKFGFIEHRVSIVQPRGCQHNWLAKQVSVYDACPTKPGCLMSIISSISSPKEKETGHASACSGMAIYRQGLLAPGLPVSVDGACSTKPGCLSRRKATRPCSWMAIQDGNILTGLAGTCRFRTSTRG